jgi:hypothetical protein
VLAGTMCTLRLDGLGDAIMGFGVSMEHVTAVVKTVKRAKVRMLV